MKIEKSYRFRENDATNESLKTPACFKWINLSKFQNKSVIQVIKKGQKSKFIISSIKKSEPRLISHLCTGGHVTDKVFLLEGYKISGCT